MAGRAAYALEDAPAPPEQVAVSFSHDDQSSVGEFDLYYQDVQKRIKDQRFRRFGIACTRRAVAALPGGTSPALDLLEASIDIGLNDAVLATVAEQAEQIRALTKRLEVLEAVRYGK